MKKLLFLPLLALLVSCATLSPSADPFVVRVEQTQTAAGAAIDMILRVDNADRGMWRSNAPAFHQWCEWLRTPTPYGSNTLARAIVIQLNVDDLKLSYKASRSMGSSNALFSAWTVLSTVLSQSTSWSNIITTPTHP